MDGIVVTVEPACQALASESDLRSLAKYALDVEGARAPGLLEINVVTDATIHDLNRRFLAHDEPTDVVTFALDRADGFVLPGPPALGEIYVSCDRAVAQCAEWGHSARQELQFLVLHGVLHLLGWNDATAEERDRMLARQLALLDAYAAAGRG